MPQLRKDPVTDRWVIIAAKRSGLEPPAGPAQLPRRQGFCPFCYGNEDKTPSEVLAYRRTGCGPNQHGWKVRVVPNKFPALQIEGELTKEGHGIYDRMAGVGVHEVIVEHPDHDAGFHSYGDKDVEMILWSYRDRYVDLLRDPRFKYSLIFKNSGATAGASIDHPHSQLIATPVVPKRVVEELTGAERYFKYKERCVFCDVLRQELAAGTRLVSVNDDFVALCPFASRFPYEMVILPRRHASDFAAIDEAGIRSCAVVLRSAMRRLVDALGNPAYNYMLHTSPADHRASESYHWHIEVVPRLTRVAGFEFASGFYANPVPPEEAAARLAQEGAGTTCRS